MKSLIYLLSFGLLTIINVEGQEGLDFINISTGSELEVPKQIFPIVDNDSGNLSILIKYRNTIKAYLFDDNQNLVSEFETTLIPKKVNNFIGSSISNSKFNLFFTNNNNSKFESLKIDFNNKTIHKSTIDLNLKGEYLIGSFKNDGNIYLLSVIKDSSILKLYALNFENKVKEKKIDLSQESFKKFNGLKTSLYYLITNNEKPSKTQSSNINYNIPNSLEATSAINKVYFRDGLVTITNDNTSSHTNLIQINIKDGNYTYYEIPKKGFLKQELRTESNSFIIDNYFFSIYATTDKMAFAVYDLETKSFIKEYKINGRDSITFKNTPITKSIGRRTKTKEPINSSKFLRDVVNSNLGVSVYKRNELFVVSIGGSEKEKVRGFAIVGGMLGGAFGAALISAFESYNLTISKKIDCLFNENFNHIQGKVPENGFDRIKNFINGHKMNGVHLQTVFKYKELYIFGFYNRNTGIYKFLKFAE